MNREPIRTILEKRQERGFTFISLNCGHLLRWHPGQEPGTTRGCPSCPATSLEITTCRTCDARILWGRTINAKSIPLDAEPNPAGNCLIDRTGIVTVNTGDWTPIGSTRHHAHHSTCPNPIRTPKGTDDGPARREDRSGERHDHAHAGS